MASVDQRRGDLPQPRALVALAVLATQYQACSTPSRRDKNDNTSSVFSPEALLNKNISQPSRGGLAESQTARVSAPHHPAPLVSPLPLKIRCHR